jgi:Zn-dependent protease with chaperone function
LVAHELIHYRDNHVLIGSALAAVGAFPFCWLLFAVYRRAERRKPPPARTSVRGLRSADMETGEHAANRFPQFMLIAVILLFLIQPINNQISIRMESAADRHALELYPNAEASLGLHRKLAIHNLSDPAPPALYRLFFGTHPSLIERMARDLEAMRR